MTDKKVKDILKLVISIVACGSAGLVGSIFTTSAIPTWYSTIQKPSFTPPNWLFAPVWTILYLLMAIAAFIIWRRGTDNQQVRTALIIFLIQLVLNALWSFVFFGLQSILSGVVVIILLWIAIVCTVLAFARISTAAGALLAPYLLWVSFAAALNVSIFMLNR